MVQSVCVCLSSQTEMMPDSPYRTPPVTHLLKHTPHSDVDENVSWRGLFPFIGNDSVLFLTMFLTFIPY